MLTNERIDTYVATAILPQTQTRRLANGSIDYTFYDRRARYVRAVDLRRLGQTVNGWLRA